MVELPNVFVSSGWQLGREPSGGYQRGWGMEFGDLTAQVEADSLFQAAIAASEGLSILDRHRRTNLFLLTRFFLSRLKSQNIVEFGSYRGGSALFLSFLLKELHPGARIYSLDTFEGMPATDKSIDAHSAGDFKDADIDNFRRARDRWGLDNLEIIPGLFEDTFPKLAAGGIEIGLAHIDCDIYSAVKYSIAACWPHMVAGGYVILDDATTSSCLGATQAVEELIMERKVFCEQIFPHFVFRANPPLSFR